MYGWGLRMDQRNALHCVDDDDSVRRVRWAHEKHTKQCKANQMMMTIITRNRKYVENLLFFSVFQISERFLLAVLHYNRFSGRRWGFALRLKWIWIWILWFAMRNEQKVRIIAKYEIEMPWTRPHMKTKFINC